MTYQEMQKAEAELNAAMAPVRKQRGATKAQLAWRAHSLRSCVNCGESFGSHSVQQTQDCANARS